MRARASHPSGRLFMNEPSQVASWYDSGIRLLAAEAKASSETEPDTLTLTLSDMVSWYESGMRSSANEPILPPATLPLSAAVVSWFDSGTRLVGTELVEEPAVSPPEQVELEVSMDVARLPPPPPTPLPSPPPSGNMEAPSVLDALLPWGVKAAEMVDAVFRPVAEQATQVVDVRLSEAPVPSRLAAADRVEKLKFVVPRYVLAVAQLAYEDATATLADVWTPEAQEKAQRAAAELVAVSKGLVKEGIEQTKKIAKTLAEQVNEKQLAEQASSRADASRQAADRINYLKTREAELQTLIAQELAAAEEGAMAAGLAVVERRNRMAADLAQKRKAMLLKREGRSAISRREGIAKYGVAKAAEIAATKKAAVASEEERHLAEQNEEGRIAAVAVAAAEAGRFCAEQAEAERVAAKQSEGIAAESAAAAEAARLAAAAQAEVEKFAAEQAEAERRAADAEAARLATAAQAEVERFAAEQAEAERRAADAAAAQAEVERFAAEQAEAERRAADAEAARLAAADEKGEDEKQRVAAQKAKTEKGEAEKAGAETAQSGTVQEEGWSVQAAAEKAEAKRLAARMRTPNGVVILGGDNLPGFTTGNTWS